MATDPLEPPYATAARMFWKRRRTFQSQDGMPKHDTTFGVIGTDKKRESIFGSERSWSLRRSLLEDKNVRVTVGESGDDIVDLSRTAKGLFDELPESLDHGSIDLQQNLESTPEEEHWVVCTGLGIGRIQSSAATSSSTRVGTLSGM
jgi:hypothetical protein